MRSGCRRRRAAVPAAERVGVGVCGAGGDDDAVQVGGRTSGRTGRTAGSAAAGGTPNRRRRRARSRRTHGACTTCTATSMSGRRTAGTRATHGRRRTAQRGRAAETAVGVCCVAVPGSTARASSVRRLASGSTSETASASSGFVWRGRSRLESFPLYLLHAPRAAPAATVPQGPGAVVHCCAGGPARGLPRSAISTTRTTSVPRRRHGRRPSWSTGGRRAPAAVSRGEWPVPFRIVSASRHACPPSGSGAAQTPRPVVR